MIILGVPKVIIIKENPDTNYFKILERFYRSISYQTTNEELQYDFYSSWTKLADKYEAFLSALATYKNKRSSEMIDTIIKRKLYPQYNMDRISQNYEFTIYNLLKENECSVYQGLIKQLEYRGKAFNKQIDTDEIPEMDANYDTTFSSKHDERYW